MPLRFISNTTKESKQTLVNRLNNLGLPADSSEVFTSLIAAKQYVKGHNLRPWLMLEEDAKLDFSDLDTENPNAVVVGLAPSNFNYQSMNQAFQYDSEVLSKLVFHSNKNSITFIGTMPDVYLILILL